MKKDVKLTIQEVENRNIPTFLSESALAAARCTTTTTTTSTCSSSSEQEAPLIVVETTNIEVVDSATDNMNTIGDESMTK